MTKDTVNIRVYRSTWEHFKNLLIKRRRKNPTLTLMQLLEEISKMKV